MAGVANLQDIVDAISMIFDEMKSFVDRETGKVITVSLDDLHAAEVDDEEDADERALAIVIDPGRYAWLPRKYEVNDWEIMQEFCETVESPRQRERMLRAIQGRGAFGRFKDLAAEFGLLEEWYAFQDDSLREIAREWCKAHRIAYIEKKRRAFNANHPADDLDR